MTGLILSRISCCLFDDSQASTGWTRAVLDHCSLFPAKRSEQAAVSPCYAGVHIHPWSVICLRTPSFRSCNHSHPPGPPTSTSMLKPFQIRDLVFQPGQGPSVEPSSPALSSVDQTDDDRHHHPDDGPRSSPRVVQISAGDYNALSRSNPQARLTYVDLDDGDTITVSGCPFLSFKRGRSSSAAASVSNDDLSRLALPSNCLSVWTSLLLLPSKPSPYKLYPPKMVRFPCTSLIFADRTQSLSCGRSLSPRKTRRVAKTSLCLNTRPIITTQAVLLPPKMPSRPFSLRLKLSLRVFSIRRSPLKLSRLAQHLLPW